MHVRQESYWKILQGNRERRRQEMSLHLGEIQKLEIVKKVEFVVYLEK